MLTRRSLLAAPALALSHAAPAARPNFVFILVDDLRYNALSCTGHPFAKTPHIDRIAHEGMRFENNFVTISLCSPSRACFLTGQYPHRHGVTNNGDHNALSHQLTTFPSLLQKSGYETAYVGKWHMGNDDMPRPGFNRWVSFKGQGVYTDPALNIDGQAVNASGYMTDLLSGHANDFLRRKRTQPFCLYLAHKAVHGPFTPADRHKDLYTGMVMPRKANCKDPLDGKPVLRRPVIENAQKKAAKKQQQPNLANDRGGPGNDVILNQLRCNAAIDDGVGQIFAALEETKQLDNTVVIFTSDNGYFWGEHGLGDKRASYEESIRIPMVARYPRLIKAGSVAPQMTLNIDIAPTCMDLAGLKPHPQMQGRSLAPVMRGKPQNWRTQFLTEYFAEPQFQRIPSYQCVREERWKLTHYTDLEGADELYDLRSDPEEMRNLIADPAAKTTIDRLRADLQKLLA
jgi:N-acetylglucosamine-6-sulfatase